MFLKFDEKPWVFFFFIVPCWTFLFYRAASLLIGSVLIIEPTALCS